MNTALHHLIAGLLLCLYSLPAVLALNAALLNQRGHRSRHSLPRQRSPEPGVRRRRITDSQVALASDPGAVVARSGRPDVTDAPLQNAAIAARLLLAGSVLFAPLQALATEGSGTSKALGVDTVLAGVMPPPGLRMTTFLGYYEAHKTLDGSGNPRPNISNFDLNAGALTLRFQYVWPAKLLDANIETRVGLSAYVDAEVSFDLQTPAGLRHRQGAANGLGDMLLAPILLGWHSERFHQIAGLEFFLPTGTFDATQIANTSRGYYSGGPAYFFTWFPTDETEVSVSSIYLYNWKNPDSQYQSGQEVNIDYGLGYALTHALQAGVSGYYYQQVTDDKLNGVALPGGNRGRAVAIGPFVRYHPSKDWGITFKWQWETLVENRPEGNRFFLQFAWQF